MESDTSRSPGANPETYTDLDEEDYQPPDEITAIYEGKVKDLTSQIKMLEELLPKRGKQRLCKLEPFRFTCTVKPDHAAVPRFVSFSRLDIIYIMKDLFNAHSEDNNFCYYEIANLYTLWDKNISHISLDLYADPEDLVRVLYVLDGMCSKIPHEYKHEYRGELFDTDEAFQRFIDSISAV